MDTDNTVKQTLTHIVRQHALQHADELAYVLHDPDFSLSMSWSQYDKASSDLAVRLAGLSLPAQSIVAILLADGPLNHLVFLACEKAGIVALGLSPRAGQQEFIHLVRHSQAVAIIAHEFHDGVSIRQRCAWLNLPDIFPIILADDALEHVTNLKVAGYAARSVQQHPACFKDTEKMFLLNTTSGTTGLPKCVVQNQRRWFYFHSLVMEAAELSSNDVMMSLLPAAVGFGLWSSHFTPTILGIPTILLPKFDVEATLDAIERQRVTVLAAVSTQFIMLLNSPSFEQRDLSSLRILYTGGERVPYDRAKVFEDKTGAKVLQFYGSNETGAVSCTTIHDSQQHRLTSAGKPIPAMQVQLIDNNDRDVTKSGFGQPVCKGPALSLGYYRDEEANRALYHENGAIKTGDLAQIDAYGYLRVCGRQGDFIIRGGKNISGLAVEEACLLHPVIRQVAVIAMPDEVFGERVCLFAVLAGDGFLELADLVKFLADSGCSKENWPERLESISQLPLSSGGKIAKGELKDILSRRLRDEKTG